MPTRILLWTGVLKYTVQLAPKHQFRVLEKSCGVCRRPDTNGTRQSNEISIKYYKPGNEQDNNMGDRNKLKFNEEKTKTMLIPRRNRKEEK